MEYAVRLQSGRLNQRLFFERKLWIAYGAIILIAAFQLASYSVNHDVGGFLLEVRGLGEGRPYLDMNMPSNIWLPYLSVFLSEHLPFYLADIHQSVIFVFALICTTLVFLLARSCGAPDLVRFAAALGITSVLLILPGYQFGQREHLFALSCAPLFLLIYRKRAGVRAPKSISVLTACVAAFGASQKPFFILILLGVGGIDVISRRFRSISLELVLTYCLIAIYLLWITQAHPTYFSQMLPGALATYGAMRLPLHLALLMAFMTPLASIKLFFLTIAMYGIGSYISADNHPHDIRWLLCFVVVGILAWGSGFVQRFGFDYHFLPFKLFVGCTSVIVFAWLIERSRDYLSGRSPIWRKLKNAAAGFFLVLTYLLLLMSQLSTADALQLYRQNVLEDPFTRYLQELPSRTPILMLSTRVTPITPVHAYSDIRWTGYLLNLLFLLPVANAPTEPEDAAAREPSFIRFVNDSFTHPSPQIVFVDVSTVMNAFLTFRHPNILDFLTKYPSFRDVWADYEKVGHIKTVYNQELDIYRKRQGSPD